MGLVIEVLSSLLAGSPFGPHIPVPFRIAEIQNLGHFFAALDLRRFVDVGVFKVRMDQMIREIKNLPLAPGCDEILVAGEPEARSRRRQAQDGIRLTPEALDVLREYGFTGGQTC